MYFFVYKSSSNLYVFVSNWTLPLSFFVSTFDSMSNSKKLCWFQYHCVHKIVNVVVYMFFRSHWIHLNIIRTHLYLYLEYIIFISHVGKSQRQKPSLT
jgi:hypothetical protein